MRARHGAAALALHRQPPPPPPLMAAATNGAAAIDGGGVRTRHTGTEPKDGEPVNTEGPPRA